MNDREAARRIWREVHWISDDRREPLMDAFLRDARVLVADVNGGAECLAASVPGTFRYLDDDLALSAVSAVTTSRIARRLGLASRVTAALVAAEAHAGADVAALGMFEQGYYDRLGFGTAAYDHLHGFDPAHLLLDRRARVPCRLTPADWRDVHRAMCNRSRGHGSCTLTPPSVMQAELGWAPNGFGLGYRDAPGGALSHFFWAEASDEHGPYTIHFLAFRTTDQFLELMALVRGLADQVRLVQMHEPAGIQLQDLLRAPLRHRMGTGTPSATIRCEAGATWQVRLCNLERALARTHLVGEPVRFSLTLHDPIAAFLEPDAPWNGLGGRYLVTLGPESHAEPGDDPAVPALTASVGAFTRLWLGVRPASGLAATDNLSGPSSLLHALDRLLCLPPLQHDWEF